MIRSFADKHTAALFERQRPHKRLHAELQRMARRRLIDIDSAEQLGDLRMPPDNRLEALKGDRRGQHSIRINDQWRICFRWKDGHAHDVEIVDYH